MNDIFNKCRNICNDLNSNKKDEARNKLIKLLDYLKTNNLKHTPLINHIIREVGLYPYIQKETAKWDDSFVYEAFKVDVGDTEDITLHEEQSFVLKKLIEGKNVAVSAPTSFGKSFIIDAYISIKKPDNVMIIVPTLALMDETRRRIQSKFSDTYKIITTSESSLENKNIFIFPQERAINYVDKISSIDLLIVDEFYKASTEFDNERSTSLIKAIIKLSEKAIQKYFLAPNISNINDNPFTEDMYFINKINFNTVFLNKHTDYLNIKNNEYSKEERLLSIINKEEKSLVYTSSLPETSKVSKIILESNINCYPNELISNFAEWIRINYCENSALASLIEKRVGIHNGSLHRPLSQIIVKLFEESEGLNTIIATSSIIEGVNTSAKNVILWNKKNGRKNLNSFTYKNIIGRGGRMFKHFIGNIYLLEKPPIEKETELSLDYPDELLPQLDNDKYSDELTESQKKKKKSLDSEYSREIPIEIYNKLKETDFQTNNFEKITNLTRAILAGELDQIKFFNNTNPKTWESPLYKILKLCKWNHGVHGETVYFTTKVLVFNWQKGTPEILLGLPEKYKQSDYFKYERSVSFNLGAILNDINLIFQITNKNIDISPFISKITHAFLPQIVYQLEEYGLPRCISKKIHEKGIIDLERTGVDIYKILDEFKIITKEGLIRKIDEFDPFDLNIINYFYEGITSHNN